MAEVPLWSPSPERVAKSRIMSFMAEVNRRHGLDLKSAIAVCMHGRSRNEPRSGSMYGKFFPDNNK